MKQLVNAKYAIFNWLVSILLVISAIFVYSCSKSGTEPENKPATKPVAVTAVSLNKSKLELSVGDKEKLVVTISPGNATNKSVAWSSSNTSVVTVQNGEVTAIKAGSATVTVKSVDGGKSATCEVTVKENSVPVTSISLDKSSVELFVDESVTLTATIEPEDATDKSVEWSSSDEGVATVSEGVVTAVKAGDATITVKSVDGGKSASCNVTVKEKDNTIHVTGISLSQESAELEEGETFELTATIEPEDATDKSVEWSSSDEGVATVSEGVVTAVKAGNAIITVKSVDGGKSASCNVTVKEKVVKVTDISLDKSVVKMHPGDVIALKATIIPENATNRDLVWSTTHSSVATVDNNGEITAHDCGDAIITAKNEDSGKYATCVVQVREKSITVTGLKLDKSSVELYEGEQITLSATIEPENATNRNIEWRSSDESVATVSDGVVTAKREGSATITAITEDGGKEANCQVRVKTKVIPVESVALDYSELEMKVGDTFKLTATILPENASNKSVIWNSEDNSVVKFVNGVLYAVGKGSTTVSVTTEDGGKTATCRVTVNEKIIEITNISLDKNLLQLYKGDVITLKAIITPENATDQTLVWSSSNESVATVADGIVTAKSKGFATIVAKNESSGKYGDCLVEVKDKVISVIDITLDRSSAEVYTGDSFTLVATISPSDATNQNINWKSSNTSVATVSNGIVTARSAGSATITATTEDGGKSATCSVVVKARVTGITLDRSSVAMNAGETFKLTATITPSNASNKNVIWKSSNTSVATVSNGIVTARSAGTATITATTEDGGKTATCQVSVKYPVTGITLDRTDVEIYAGESFTLKATVTPSDATNKRVIWSTSNNSLATVNNGVVKALKPGKVTITATAEDGGKSATCNVVIKSKVDIDDWEDDGERNEGEAS